MNNKSAGHRLSGKNKYILMHFNAYLGLQNPQQKEQENQMDHEALCYTPHCRGTEYRVRKWAPGPEWLLSYLDKPKLTIPIQMATRTFIATAFQSPIHLTESRGWVTPLQGSLCMPYTTNFQVLNILDTLNPLITCKLQYCGNIQICTILIPA
jgi:hypothetical protein